MVDRQKGWFYSILLSISEAAIVIDACGKVNLLNPIAEVLTGLNRDEACGKEFADLFNMINEHTRVEVENLTKSVLQEGRTVRLSDYPLIIRRDGTERQISGNCMPVRNDTGEIIGAVLLIRHDPTWHEKFETDGIIEEDLRSLVENAPVAIAMFDQNMRYLVTSRRWLEDYRLTSSNIIGRSHYDIFPEIPEQWKAAHQLGLAGEAQMNHKDRFVRDNGSVQWLNWALQPWYAKDGSVGGIIIFTEDITERIKVEESLIENEGRLRRAELLARVAHYAFDADGGNPVWSDGFMEMWGFDRNTNPTFDDIVLRVHPDDKDWVMGEFEKAGQELRGFNLEYRIVRIDGAEVNVHSFGEVTLNDKQGGMARFFGTLIDITDLRRAEKNKSDLEGQLQHAQKMESVGRLAGGVAHDFNNMLAVILGYTDLAIERVEATKPLHSDLMQIRNAAQRSANLTRQLLAFARKQIAAPKILDLNDVIEDMLKMLRQLIGEDINLAWTPGDNLGLVRMDTAQVDQILVNLCVNARDAISGIGKITIETNNVTFDEAYCAEHPGFLTGSYIMVALSDNGIGMDQETLSKIFDPYFTTKQSGKGTGLGLSTAYGIVKQNEGFINVYSELGQGTTFKIYLSRYTAKSKASVVETHDQVVRGGSETILLVEDETMLLDIGIRMLKSLGYNVLAANRPTDALIFAREHREAINLLITDVVMPEMNGRELSEQLKAITPGLKILYMSGYTANVIAHHGILDEGVMLISKPFTKNELAAKVRETITRKIPG